jgi:hypothetical protein
MALVKKLKETTLDRDVPHREVECTYCVIHDDNGLKYLQLDTYGSAERQMPGKKSQSLRLSPQAIKQLREILSNRF